MQHLNNTVIKVLNKEHGKQVIEWWKSQGVKTNLEGSVGEEGNYKSIYYGFINNYFSCFTLSSIEIFNAKIIELPIEYEIPTLGKGVLMEVSDNEDFSNSCKRYVFGKAKNHFFAWQATLVEYTIWKYARRIQEIPEYTMEELVAKIGHNFKIKK